MSRFTLHGYTHGQLPTNEQLWFPELKTWGEELKVKARETKACYSRADIEKWVLDTVEAEAEKKVLEGVATVVQCGVFANPEFDLCRQMAIRVGVVPLRWAARRILLAPPDVAGMLTDGQEPARTWRLWRYRFDPEWDGYTIGRPFQVEKALRAEMAAGDYRRALIHPGIKE